MFDNKLLPLAILTAALAMGGCASSPTTNATAPTTVSKASGKWTKATEEEVAAKLDKELFEAVKGWTYLKKDGELRFCKRYKDVGSSIATIKCLDEAQVRTQVENNRNYRDEMRNKVGKCTLGRTGLGGPCGGG